MLQESVNFIEYIKKSKKNNKITLFFDIETLQFNQDTGNKSPSSYKNITFSVCVGYIHPVTCEVVTVTMPNFKVLFDYIFKACALKNGRVTAKATIEFIAHNNNKYDNHFLLKDLLYYYPHIKQENMYLMNAIDNDNTYKVNYLSKEEKQGIILQKRIKSKNNLELEFFINNIHFKVVDNYLKTNMSIRTLGVKLLKINKIKEDELKTTFDYLKWNLSEDLTEEQARDYASYVFTQLTEEEHIYIRNDVIILGRSVQYYDVLFPNFDYSKITFTSNILQSFKNSDLTTFQLLNQVGNKKDKLKINYTEFQFCGINFFDWLRPFYKGGLNFYNYNYIGKIINDRVFSMDINSSYPHEMYNNKIPTFLVDYKDYKKEEKIEIDYDDNYFYMYRIDMDTFNYEIMSKIESKIIRQIITKYYASKNDYISINTNTLKMIEKIAHIKISKLTVNSLVKYECVNFGNKEKIFDYYKIKVQGKLDHKIEMISPMEYTITEEINTNLYTNEEIDSAKVHLNGLYGIPALRPYFHLFKLLEDNSFESLPNGYKNTERNIVFSVFITSMAIKNLLSPLQFLTSEEIEQTFLYCDTDSLYFKDSIKNKIPKSYFDDIALGKWGIQEKEYETIDKFYILNHKKYAYYKTNHKDNKSYIVVKCGGIDLASFNLAVSFEEFINMQFSHGVQVPNQKSIYNKDRTISIYQSLTEIEQGQNYDIYFSKEKGKDREKLLERIRAENQDGFEDILYIESSLGTFSQTDVHPHINSIEGKQGLEILLLIYKRIKNYIKNKEETKNESK